MEGHGGGQGTLGAEYPEDGRAGLSHGARGSGDPGSAAGRCSLREGVPLGACNLVPWGQAPGGARVPLCFTGVYTACPPPGPGWAPPCLHSPPTQEGPHPSTPGSGAALEGNTEHSLASSAKETPVPEQG